ncbi:MAG: hypothetical protein WC758_03895 [Candidatus Woesearchaeota archaeon]|jgi:hypothetical protein
MDKNKLSKCIDDYLIERTAVICKQDLNNGYKLLKNCGDDFSRKTASKLIKIIGKDTKFLKEQNNSPEEVFNGQKLNEYISYAGLHVLVFNFKKAVEISTNFLNFEEYTYYQCGAANIIHYFGDRKNEENARMIVRSHISKLISGEKSVKNANGVSITELTHCVETYARISGICAGLMSLVEGALDQEKVNKENCLLLKEAIESYNSNALNVTRNDDLNLNERLYGRTTQKEIVESLYFAKPCESNNSKLVSQLKELFPKVNENYIAEFVNS